MAIQRRSDGSPLTQSVFTTGQVAKICNVSQQTIIRCFDRGLLQGFRVPGSKFRRIPRESLIKFIEGTHCQVERLGSGKALSRAVDDGPDIGESVGEVLQRDGRFDTETASTGFDAGIKTKEFRPDLIVLDYMLPDINGNAVCRTVRSDKSLEHVRIIIVSGVVNREDVRTLLEAGADDFLQKPFDVKELVNRISELLGE